MRPRVLNATCIAISLAMNALAAGHGWRDLAIWVMPAAVYALASDTLIEHAHRDSRELQAYLKREAIDWALRPGQAQPLITDAQWRLLFEPDGQGWYHRDLLLMCILQALASRGWPPGSGPAEDPAARAWRDDTASTDEEDQ
jgi:hypothetical protein